MVRGAFPKVQALGMCPIGQMPIVSGEQKDSSSLIPGPLLLFIVVVYTGTKPQNSNYSKTFKTKALRAQPFKIYHQHVHCTLI